MNVISEFKDLASKAMDKDQVNRGVFLFVFLGVCFLALAGLIAEVAGIIMLIKGVVLVVALLSLPAALLLDVILIIALSKMTS